MLKFMDPNFAEVYRWRTVSIFEEADSQRVVYWYGDADLQTCYEPKFLNWIKLGMNVSATWWLCRVFKLCLKCELCAHNFSPYTEGRRTKYGEEDKEIFWQGIEWIATLFCMLDVVNTSGGSADVVLNQMVL